MHKGSRVGGGKFPILRFSSALKAEPSDLGIRLADGWIPGGFGRRMGGCISWR